MITAFDDSSTAFDAGISFDGQEGQEVFDGVIIHGEARSTVIRQPQRSTVIRTEPRSTIIRGGTG